jgi:hypothetical protein
MRYLLAAAVLCCVATAAQAETALALRQRCTGMTGIANASMCRNTVGAVVSDMRDNAATYCLPADLDKPTALGVVQTFLKDHPEEMHLAATDAITKALAAAYPCPAKP